VVDFDFPATSASMAGVVTVQGKPAVNGHIQATIATGSGDESAYAEVQSDGTYRFDALPPGVATLQGNASDGSRDGRISLTVTIPRSGLLQQDIVTTLPARIHGTVTGANGGYNGVAALRGEISVPAIITPQLYAQYQEIDEMSRSIGSDGAYSLDGIAPGVYTVVAYCAPSQSADALPQLRHASTVVTVSEGADVTLDFSLR
jgi:hypothetical protein